MSSTDPTSQPASEGYPSSPIVEGPLRRALIESNERFEVTFEQAAVGLAHVAPDGTWLRINKRLCEILGYTESELRRKTFQDVTYPDDLAGDLAYVDQLLNGEIESYSLEKRYLRKNGAVIWVNIMVSLVRTPSKEPKYFIGVVQDISDRKQAEANFRASEQRFRQAIANAPLPIAICAESGEMLHLSRGWTQITGYGADEISTIEAWAEKAYGEHKDAVTRKIYQLFNQDDQLADKTEGKITTKAGKERIWQFHSMPLGESDGQKLAMGMASDITDLKETQSELAKKLTQQSVIAQIGQLALGTPDLQTVFDRATRAVADALDVEYCKVLQLSPDNTQLKLISGVGWQPGLVGQAYINNDLTSQAGYTLASRQAVVVEELSTESRFSGPSLLVDHQVVSGISTIVYQQKDSIFGILGIHTARFRQFSQADVDFVQAIANILSTSIERHLAEQSIQQLNRELEQRVIERTVQLEESNSELKAFTYTVSHDLRAPLRAMQGFAQALKEDYVSQLDEMGHEYAQRIVGAAHQMDGLILDLLAYSQLSRSDIRVVPVSLDLAIGESIAALQPLIDQQQAKISVEAMPKALGSHRIFVQVFTNLLSNAIKFVPSNVQPDIQINCEQRADKVRIWVTDNGLGIDLAHQQRIFSVFERLHGIESYAGTGIGLAIVKKAVARMGGDVGVVSSLGEGSQFWIELHRC